MADLSSRLDKLSPAQRQLLLSRLRQEGAGAQEAEGVRPPLARRPAHAPEAPPLSFAQQRLWFLTRLDPDSPLYNVPGAIRLTGRLDLGALERALRRVVERHEILRTTFEVEGEQVVQRISPEAQLPLAVLDLSADRFGDDVLEEALERDVRRPFDLARGPLVRALLVRRGAETHLLLLTLHHIVSDAWSAGVMTHELGTLYRAFAAGQDDPLPPLPVQYSDFAAWQRSWLQGDELERLMAPWRECLADAPRAVGFPPDRRAPDGPSSAGDQVPVNLEARTAALQDLAGAESASPFMVVLALFAYLLGRHAGRDDVVVGTPIAGRTHPEIEGLIGFFVNTLALRLDLTGGPSLRTLVRRAREVALDAFSHQDLPYEKLVAELRRGGEREAAEAPLFRVVLQVRNEPRSVVQLPGLELEPVEVVARTAKFDMVVNLTQDGGLGGVWKYATDLYDRVTVERLVARFETLTGHALAEPDRPLDQLPLLPAAERRTLLEDWNGKAPPVPADDTLAGRFAARAKLRGDAVAVADGADAWTYAELARRARCLAGHLRRRGAGPGRAVGLLLERSPRLVAALLAVVESGAVAVPLDPHHPEERHRLMLADVGAELLITEEALAERATALVALVAGAEGQRVETVDVALALEVPEAPEAPEAPEKDEPADGAGLGPGPLDPAYVIYTSGSTGAPKGVVVPHGRVVRLFDVLAAAYELGDDDVWTFFHSVAFDFSVWEIWGALLTGGRLEVVTYWQSRSPVELHELIRRRRVTVLSQTPSAFRQLMTVDRDAPEGLDSLRWVVFGGEALDPASLAPWWRRYGDDGPGLVNMYGITETTVHVTHRLLEPGDAERPGSFVGRPLADLRVRVVDPVPGRGPLLAPIGVAGELWVAGAGVASGYVGRPGLTAERFVPDPWAERSGARAYRSGDLARWQGGELEYLGRIDHQIKVRGFRIEPGEIEAALRAEATVAEAVVLPMVDGDGRTRLRACVVATAGVAAPPPRELRERLARRLPEHMVPAEVMVLDALPLTSTGKLDRRALAALARPAEDGAPLVRRPETPLEQRLEEIWRQVLGLEGDAPVDATADFFDLGGDSIAAAVLANRLQEVVGEIVHVVAVFDAPTITRLAGYLEEHYPAATRGGRAADLDAAVPAGPPPVDRPTLDRLSALVAEHRSFDPGRSAARGQRVQGPIFVLAPPRSGTTLLRVILGGHPELFAPPELELLGFDTLERRQWEFSGRDAFWLEGALRALMELDGVESDEARAEIERLIRDGASPLDLYGRFQDALGGRCLVDKTPSYTLDPAVLARAEDEMEGARYVHLVRHPSGMVHSFEEARLDQVFFRHPHGLDRRRLAEALWILGHENVLAFFERVPAARRHRVVFEELVTEPERVVGELARFLGLDLHPHMLDPYREGERRMTDGLHRESRMLGDVKFHQHRRIDPAVAERWREHLDASDLGEPARRLAQRLGYELAVEETPSAGGPAAERVMSAMSAAEEPEAPLSFAQERLWFLDQLEPGLATYNLPLTLELEGALDRLAFARALARTVKRHEALRTTLAAGAEGPRQVIHPPPPPALPVVDLSRLPAAFRDAEARRLAEAAGRRPFDLARGPLVRVALLVLGPERHWALLTLHHAIADGWSLRLLAEEVRSAYAALARGAEPDLEPLAVQYGDFARWQRDWLSRGVLDEQLAYWRAQLADGEPLELPTDRSRPAVGSARGDRRSIDLPERLWRGVDLLARQRDATPFMVLLAAFFALLGRWTGQRSVAVGTPVAGRNRSELEPMIGLFVNLLVLRVELDPEAPFAEAVDRVRSTALDAFARQDVPFERLVEELAPRRDASRNPLFQVAFQTRPPAPAASRLVAPRMTPVALGTRLSKFDLKLALGDGHDDRSAVLEFSTELFDATTAHRLLHHLERLLARAVEAPETPLGELPLLGRAQRFQLLTAWNDTAARYPREASIHSLFMERVAERPEATAIDGASRFDYRELARRSHRLAHHLAASGVGRGDLVAVCLERSAAAVVAFVAILEVGAAYLPLAPDDPPERLAALLADAGAVVVVSRSELAGNLPNGGPPRVLLDTDADAIDHRPAEPLDAPGVGGSDLAYVIYTSGSTGEPKGVAVPHRAVVRLVTATDYVRLGPGRRIGQMARLSFDAATFELWGALLTGATVVGIPRAVTLEPTALARELAERRVTTLFVTTALFHQTVLAVPDAFAPVDELLVGGEVVDAARVREARAAGSPGRLSNVYGPTENTTFSLCGPVSSLAADASTVPLGRPIAHDRAHLLDRAGRPVPIGVAGEIHLAGDGLARGYRGRPAATAERFVPDPFSRRPGGRLYATGDRGRHLADGRLEFLGRFDHQVKIRGFRIEPREIEAALETHGAVDHALVMPVAVERQAPGPLEQLLVAFLVGSEPASPDSLRAHLRDRLPAYMVPARFHWTAELPLTDNGKVDRPVLLELDRRADHGGSGSEAPETPVEKELVALFAELLGRRGVGVHDDFFDLGGHSLLATQLMSRLRERFDPGLPLRLVFEHPTVASLAAVVGPAATAPADKIEASTTSSADVDLGSLFGELDSMSDEEAAAILATEESS